MPLELLFQRGMMIITKNILILSWSWIIVKQLIKNTCNLPVKKGETWTIEYSEYAQEWAGKIYIDYAHLEDLKEGTIITCQQSQVLLKVNSTEEDLAQVEVTDSGKGEIFQYDRISFDDLDNDDEEITERDKKDILWGLEYGAHVIGLSCANTAEHVESVKTFLEQNNAGEMKVFAKIETRSGLKNLNEILGIADGIILVLDELSDFKENLSSLLKRIQNMEKNTLNILLNKFKYWVKNILME